MASKIKAPPLSVPVPQNDTEANAAIARLGAIARELDERETIMNAALAGIKERAEAGAEPLKREQAARTAALQSYCGAHRDRLTQEGKVKSYDFPAGKVLWRARPPKVTLRGKAETILEALRSGPRKLRKFIRTKQEIDKEAMLADPVLARTVQGVSIGSAGEDFVVEPFEAELAEAAS